MIGQCLSNKSKSDTLSKSKKKLDLNKAYIRVQQERKIWIVRNPSWVLFSSEKWKVFGTVALSCD